MAKATATETASNNPWRIVVVQAGWVLVGRYHFNKENQRHNLTDASVIRSWGTDKGLGQLALSGPQKETVLDPCGVACVPDSSVLFVLECNDEVWDK